MLILSPGESKYKLRTSCLVLEKMAFECNEFGAVAMSNVLVSFVPEGHEVLLEELFVIIGLHTSFCISCTLFMNSIRFLYVRNS
jgi:hypothetical protein